MTSRSLQKRGFWPWGAIVWRGDGVTFGILARVFHWGTPLLLILSFGLVWSISVLPGRPERAQALALHRTIGLLVLSLTIIRLAWRMIDHLPAPIGSRPLRWAAGAVSTALYTVLVVTPILGWTYTNARGHAVALLGIPLPSIVFKDEYFSRVAIYAHERLAYGLLGLVALHIAAALLHHFWLRDVTLKRMWRG